MGVWSTEQGSPWGSIIAPATVRLRRHDCVHRWGTVTPEKLTNVWLHHENSNVDVFGPPYGVCQGGVRGCPGNVWGCRGVVRECLEMFACVFASFGHLRFWNGVIKVASWIGSKFRFRNTPKKVKSDLYSLQPILATKHYVWFFWVTLYDLRPWTMGH